MIYLKVEWPSEKTVMDLSVVHYRYSLVQPLQITKPNVRRRPWIIHLVNEMDFLFVCSIPNVTDLTWTIILSKCKSFAFQICAMKLLFNKIFSLHLTKWVEVLKVGFDSWIPSIEKSFRSDPFAFRYTKVHSERQKFKNSFVELGTVASRLVTGGLDCVAVSRHMAVETPSVCPVGGWSY